MTKLYVVAKKIKLNGEFFCEQCSKANAGRIALLNIDSSIYQLGWIIDELHKNPELRYHVSYGNTPNFERILALLKDSGLKFTFKKKENVRTRCQSDNEPMLVNEYLLKRKK